jgi:hypothetical protein
VIVQLEEAEAEAAIAAVVEGMDRYVGVVVVAAEAEAAAVAVVEGIVVVAGVVVCVDMIVVGIAMDTELELVEVE